MRTKSAVGLITDFIFEKKIVIVSATIKIYSSEMRLGITLTGYSEYQIERLR